MNEGSPNSPALHYVVLVDDNFHPYDEDERYEFGRFATLDDAITECERLVMENLVHLYRRGMTADELFEQYTAFGEDPFVVDESNQLDTSPFSAWEFARSAAGKLVLIYRAS